MPLTAFSPLVSLSGNTGRLPDALTPADEIQFSYSYQGDFQGSVGGDFSQIPLEARFEVRDAGGTLLLAWGFKVTYTVVTFAGTFSYYVSSQKVTVTYPVPAPATLGDPNGIAIPGGGGDIGLGGLSFQESFESPIFKVPLPPGTTIRVTFHTAGYPSLTDIAGLTVRTERGGAWATGVRHAADGTAVILLPATGGVQQVRLVGQERTVAAPQLLAWGADGPAFLLRGAGASEQIALYPKGGNTLARVSQNDGATYGDAMTIYTGFVPLGAVRQAGGKLIVLLAKGGGGAFVGFRDGGGAWSDPAAATLPAGVKLSTPGILLGEDGAGLDFVYADAGNTAVLRSENDGVTWT